MDFYPSVFPIRYSGALSSVTVVHPKRVTKGEGDFAYDPMNLKAAYVGVLDDIDFFASVRRSFYYVQFGPMGSGRDNRPSFSDVAAQVGLPLGRGHRLQANFISGSDRVLTNLRDVYTDMGESGSSFTLGLQSQMDAFETELTVFAKRHDFSLVPSNWWGSARTAQHETGVRLDVDASLADWLEAGGGLRVARNGFYGNLLDEYGFQRGDNANAGYLYARFRPEERVELDLGVRYDDLAWVRDRVAEPRAVLRLGPFGGVELRAGYRLSHQHPYAFLRQSGASIVFDNDFDGYEMFRDGVLGAKQADHYSLAADIALAGQTSLSVETYWKEYGRLPTWQEDSLGGRCGFGSQGTGFARGVEFVLERKPHDGWGGWLTYGLAWSRKQQGTDTTLFWDEHDRRHSVSLSVEKRFRGDWTWTTTFNLYSGSPYTPLVYTRSPNGVEISDLNRGGLGYVVRGEKHSERVPVYHRLDFRLQKDLPHLPLKPFLYVEVLNFYNRENVYHLVQFETSEGTIATGRFAGIQFIPLFGIGGRF